MRATLDGLPFVMLSSTDPEKLMNNPTRRTFLETAGLAAVAQMVARPHALVIAGTPGDDIPQRSVPKPPRIYEVDKIPRVDIHAHIRQSKLELTDHFVDTMDAGGVTVSLNLSCTRQMLEEAALIREKWKGRILLCPGDYDTRDELWWSEDDLTNFKEHRCAGTKIWAQYRQGVLADDIVRKIRRQGELDLPVIGFHVADPPEGKYMKPNYWECIYEAAKLIERCPQTTFIMAHGYWLMNEDRGLDVLSDYFDRYPNLNVDLCAVYQWWDPPNPSHQKLRDFVIAYKDRLLFGTDGKPSYTTPERLKRIYRILESDDDQLQPFFRDEGVQRGLQLPVDVLNYVYYWNAARLVPEVRRSLEQCGHTMS